jgi:hypothetical protein
MNPEDLLTDALHDRVSRTDYPSTPLSEVAGRAGAIRARRRRTTALTAAAAVALVAVPGAVWLGRSPGTSPSPGTTQSSGPTTQPTSHPQNPLALADLPMGARPGIDYLVGDTYVTMNGDRMSSPDFATAGTATPARGGILTATARPPQGPFLFSKISLVNGGRSQALGCGTASFAMSTDGIESAYWVADSCSPGGAGKLYSGVNNTMGDSGPAYVATPTGAIDEPVGILRQGVVVNDEGSDRGDGPNALLVATDGSGTTTRIDPLVSAGGSDMNNNVVSGVLRTDTSTGAVVDASSGDVKWRAPGWQLGQFSNDGKYVVGHELSDPFGYAIFDAVSGAQIARFDSLGEKVTIQQVAWDFNDTVLAVASDSDQEAIVRFDLDGHPTRATETRPLGGGNDVYHLATRS